MMGTPIHKIISEWPVEEVLLWKYRMKEPRGARRDDWRTATVVAAIYQVMASFKKGSRQIKPRKCLLKFEKPLSVEQQGNQLIRIFGVGPKKGMTK